MARTWALLIGLALISASADAETGVTYGGQGEPEIQLIGGGVGLHPGPDGKFDLADFLPAGGLDASALTTGNPDLAGMIPPDDNGQMTNEFAETLAARMIAPVLASESGGSSSQDLLDWAGASELAQTQPGVGSDMAAQIAGYLDSAPGMPAVGGPVNDVMPQISGGVQEVFSTLPIPGITNLLAGQ